MVIQREKHMFYDICQDWVSGALDGLKKTLDRGTSKITVLAKLSKTIHEKMIFSFAGVENSEPDTYP